MQNSVAPRHSANPVRRGFVNAAKIAACIVLGAFAFQIALGAAGLFVEAPTHRVAEQWPNLLIVTIGLALLYRAAGSLAFHIQGRSPSWAWARLRSRIVKALTSPAAA